MQKLVELIMDSAKIVQVQQMTREQRRKLYMKSTKAELVEIILNQEEAWEKARLDFIDYLADPFRFITTKDKRL